MAKRNQKMPRPNSPEWNAEVSFYLSAPAPARGARAIELGFTDPTSYANVFRRQGIRVSIPQPTRKKFNRPPIIRESSLIIFDTQIPFHDAPFLSNLLDLAMAWGIKQGISGGDLLNMTSFSNFFEHPEDKIWAKEREIAISVLKALTSAVPKWLLIMGNHETFLLKKLAEQLGHEDILRLLDKPEGINATDYYYCKVLLGGSTWRITHPRNISVIHSRIPQRLCDKFHCNLVSGHGHLAGLTPDYSGKYFACDVGVTCDPERLDYVALRDNIRPAQCRGGLILMESEGKCFPYHLYPSSDFSSLKHLYGVGK